MKDFEVSERLKGFRGSLVFARSVCVCMCGCAPSDNALFATLETWLEGQSFECNEEVANGYFEQLDVWRFLEINPTKK